MRRYFRPLYSLSQFNVNSLFLMKGHKYFLYRKNKTWSSVSNSSFLFEFIQKFRLFLVAGKKSTLCLFAINFVSEKYFCRKISPQKFLVPKKSTPRLAVLTKKLFWMETIVTRTNVACTMVLWQMSQDLIFVS